MSRKGPGFGQDWGPSPGQAALEQGLRETRLLGGAGWKANVQAVGLAEEAGLCAQVPGSGLPRGWSPWSLLLYLTCLTSSYTLLLTHTRTHTQKVLLHVDFLVTF